MWDHEDFHGLIGKSLGFCSIFLMWKIQSRGQYENYNKIKAFMRVCWFLPSMNISFGHFSHCAIFWKLQDKLVRINSIEDGFSGFLEHVFCMPRFFKLQAFKKSENVIFYGSADF